MSEGPQVKLVTERLESQLRGSVITRCLTTRSNLENFADSSTGATIERIFCKGKHIFFDFGTDRFLNNHLLMRGKWRKSPDRFMLLPPEIWIAFELRKGTVYDYMGQVMRVLSSEQLTEHMDSLGPDVMSGDCSEQDISEALSICPEPVGEVLLDQAVLCGVGNVAKSESLFAAGVHPDASAQDLAQDALARLARSIRQVMWDSYECGGRWTHHVYRRARSRCFECGTNIVMIRQGKQKRSTYFCPRCQPKG